MNKTKRIRIKRAVLLALAGAAYLDLPVNIKHISKSFPKCRVIPYSMLMRTAGVDYQSILNYANSEDGFSVYDAISESYVIYYNDKSDSIVRSNRYRWSIAHELGHVVLGHHKKSNRTRLFRNTLSVQEYRELEEEADYFASYLLAPYAALSLLNIRNPSDIEKYCQLSPKAASFRYDDYLKWRKDGQYKDAYDFKIRQLFYCIIDKKYKSIFKRCVTCNYSFSDKGYTYCPICGGSSFVPTSMEEYTVKYFSVKTDLTGHVLKCPNCDNEEFPKNSNYCMICGKVTVNQCTFAIQDDASFEDWQCQHTEPLPGNARYCPYCGSKTTFLKHEILKPWDQSPDTAEQIQFAEDDRDLPW